MKKKIYKDFIKRIFDIIFASIGLIISIPFSIILSIMIKADSKGTVFFKHNRVGKNGKTIKIYKFRTMVMNAEEKLNNVSEKEKQEYKQNYKIENDPRTTNIGRVLRKTSLDEVPQFLNVLKGDMSIVGPRPIIKQEILDKYADEEQNLLLSCKPGMTGKWVAYSNKNTTYEQRKEMELKYVQNISFLEDLKIVFKTVHTLIKRVIYNEGVKNERS